MRLLLSLSLLLIAGNLSAKPAHLKSVAEYVGPGFAPRLNACVLCHADGGDESDKPHNDFGKVIAEWRKDRKKAGLRSDIGDALDALADRDTDKDGIPDMEEILAGKFPGTHADYPTPAERAAAKKKLADLRAKRADYRWLPLEPVKRPAVPAVKNAAWVKNPIDAFVAEQHDKNGLKPRPETSKATLLRRVSIDLIGLPPTRDELHAFLSDTSPNAYEKVVDHLMARPEYGEAQARHWMDVWRYSDWAGYQAEIRDSQPHIWRWRDWIVESVNADKPYDRMVKEMLAADELAPGDENALRATGFLVRNWYKFSREVWLDRTVEHTAKGFLGLTVNCAKCHDHMYDPIPQTDYYSFRAIFGAHDIRTDRLPGQADTAKAGLVRVYDADAARPTYLFVRGNDQDPDKTKPIPPAVPAALVGPTFDIKPVTLPKFAVTPDDRPFVLEETKAANDAAVAKAHADLRAASARLGAVPLGFGVLPAVLKSSLIGLRQDQVAAAQADVLIAERKRDVFSAHLAVESLDAKSPAWKPAAEKVTQLQRAVAVAEAKKLVAAATLARWTVTPKGQPDPAKKLADAQAALAKAETAAKAAPSTAFAVRPVKAFPATSTGRRLALANWLADPKNPLTARVAVNHLWLRRFGTGIVPTMFDFGKNGQPPTHPKLIDWLAAELMTNGWSLKHVHRLIVLSATYRMDSLPVASDAARDPDNRFLWRQNTRRMTAEAVRDSVLAVAGELDRTRGGEEINEAAGLTTFRRSLYFRHAPEKQMTFLELFDSASPTECYRRGESVVPQQALALANSPLTQTMSRLLAAKLTKQAPAEPEFIAAAFETILSRPPAADERALCQTFLKDQAALFAGKKLTPLGGPAASKPASADGAQRARENLIHVLLNHNDFVSVR